MCKLFFISLIVILTINSSHPEIQPNNQYYHPLEVQQPYYQQYGPQPYGGGISGQFGSLAFSVGRDCDLKIESDADFQKCRTEAVVDWGSTAYTDRQIKYLCCYYWDIIDCMEYAVQSRCGQNSYGFEDYFKNFAVRKEEMRSYLERYQCIDYTYGTIKCHFFWWVIAIIVIIGFVIILIVAAICYRIFRKKSRIARIETTDVKVHK